MRNTVRHSLRLVNRESRISLSGLTKAASVAFRGALERPNKGVSRSIE